MIFDIDSTLMACLNPNQMDHTDLEVQVPGQNLNDSGTGLLPWMTKLVLCLSRDQD